VRGYLGGGTKQRRLPSKINIGTKKRVKIKAALDKIPEQRIQTLQKIASKGRRKIKKIE